MSSNQALCAEPLILTDEKRARLILMLAEGRSYAKSLILLNRRTLPATTGSVAQ